MTADCAPSNPKPNDLNVRRTCGAKTRSGLPCKTPPVRGKKRCRMHGGAFGSGAPKGNQNARKHGLFTRQAIEERKATNRMIREMRAAMRVAEDR